MIEYLNEKLFNLKVCALLSSWGKPIVVDYRELEAERQHRVYECFAKCFSEDGFNDVIEIFLPTAKDRKEHCVKLLEQGSEAFNPIKGKIRNYLNPYVGAAYGRLIKIVLESDEINLDLHDNMTYNN